MVSRTRDVCRCAPVLAEMSHLLFDTSTKLTKWFRFLIVEFELLHRRGIQKLKLKEERDIKIL